MPQTLNDVNRATVVRLLQRHRPEPPRVCLPPGCSCGHAGDHDEHLAGIIVKAIEGPAEDEYPPFSEVRIPGPPDGDVFIIS